MLNRIFKSASALTALTLIALSHSAEADTMTYNPALGTLPDAQGFTFYNDSGQPTPYVSGGILYQGSTGIYPYQYWFNQSKTVNLLQDFTMEWDGKVTSSDYTSDSNERRSGYSFRAIDSALHVFGVGITSTGVFVWNDDGPWSGSPFISFNTTSAFNDYRLHVLNGTASLFINNNFVTSVPLGSANNVPTGFENQVYFGDGTHAVGSQTQTSLFSYTFTPSAVPEPGSLALLTGTAFFGGSLLLRRYRRK